MGIFVNLQKVAKAVADPGFSVGERRPLEVGGGSADSRGGYGSKILYVETKESGPLGRGRVPDTPPRSANAKSLARPPRSANAKSLTGFALCSYFSND